jgi:hypothetical protein
MLRKIEYSRPNDGVNEVEGNYFIFIEEKPRFAGLNPLKKCQVMFSRGKGRTKGGKKVRYMGTVQSLITSVTLELWLGGTFECHVDKLEVCQFYYVYLSASAGYTA